MKTFVVIALSLLVNTSNDFEASEYVIGNLYSGTAPADGVKILTSGGEMEDAEYILYPTRIDKGKYVVTVSKVSSDLYKIDGKAVFIETKYCHEYANREEVVLVI